MPLDPSIRASLVGKWTNAVDLLVIDIRSAAGTEMQVGVKLDCGGCDPCRYEYILDSWILKNEYVVNCAEDQNICILQRTQRRLLESI